MRRIIGGVGRGLVTIGILILLFVAYQLWGTGIYEAREQTSSRPSSQQGAGQGEGRGPSAPRATTSTTTTTCPSPARRRRRRSAIIQIPKIGLDGPSSRASACPTSAKGPGHYPATPLPGQLGNAAIAGHRTTYGAPFNRLDELGASATRSSSPTLRGDVPLHGDPAARRAARSERLRARPDPGRDAHAHHLQPEVLGVAAPRRQGRARPETRARSRRPPRRSRSRAAASLDDALSGRGEPKLPTVWWGFSSPRRRAVVADLPPLPPLDDLVHGCDPVRWSSSSSSTTTSNACCPRTARRGRSRAAATASSRRSPRVHGAMTASGDVWTCARRAQGSTSRSAGQRRTSSSRMRVLRGP